MISHANFLIRGMLVGSNSRKDVGMWRVSFPKLWMCLCLVFLNLAGCASSRWSGKRSTTSQTLAQEDGKDHSDSTGRVRLGQIEDEEAVVTRQESRKARRKPAISEDPEEKSTVYELPRTDLDAEPLSSRFAEKSGSGSKRAKSESLPTKDDEDSVTRSLFEPRGQEKTSYPLYSD